MPGSTTSNPEPQPYCGAGTKKLSYYFIVYVLESLKDGKRYIGLTANLKNRIKQHNSGKSFSTRPRKPFKLIYAELCTDREDARRREHYLNKNYWRPEIFSKEIKKLL